MEGCRGGAALGLYKCISAALSFMLRSSLSSGSLLCEGGWAACGILSGGPQTDYEVVDRQYLFLRPLGGISLRSLKRLRWPHLKLF